MLVILSIIPIVLVIAWISLEFRGRTLPRLLLGIAAMCSVAVMAFLWGMFAEGFKHAEFPAPHDSPADTAIMDAADKATTNSISK